MRRPARAVIAVGAALGLLWAGEAQAQWHQLESRVTDDLHAVSAVDDQFAWAAGDNGTVLRTQDGGRSWQKCAAPSAAPPLDLRGIQAFDQDTAVAMTSGTGGSSALYKTADGCRTWRKVLANPDATGSFQALRRATAYDIYLLGSPVDGQFAVYLSHNAGDSWTRESDPGLAVPKGGAAATAGPAAMTNVLSFLAFGASAPGAPVYTYGPLCKGGGRCVLGWGARPTGPEQGQSGGIASVAGRNIMVSAIGTVTGIGTMPATSLVAVGGDPRAGGGRAAFSTDGGNSWKPASKAPDGFRSAVDFDGDHNRFIAIGPDGTDVSVDDGLIWTALRPEPGEPADAGKAWTAMSLPFVVGPNGRIGKMSHP